MLISSLSKNEVKVNVYKKRINYAGLFCLTLQRIYASMIIEDTKGMKLL